MDFDRVRDAWTHQPDGTATRTDDELVGLVVTRERAFRRRVAVRDVLELGTALCMAAAFIRVATLAPVRWPWLAAAAVTIGVGGVFVRERLRHRPSAPSAVELGASLQQALEEADHQIRLLASVAWWYLLPLGVVVALILAGTLLGARVEMGPVVWARARVVFVLPFAAVLLLVGGTFWLVWWANVRAVRRHLQPHREAIAGLIRQLAADAGEEPQ
jgi:hypothetical protein